jgi:hypothetical protein
MQVSNLVNRLPCVPCQVRCIVDYRKYRIIEAPGSDPNRGCDYYCRRENGRHEWQGSMCHRTLLLQQKMLAIIVCNVTDTTCMMSSAGIPYFVPQTMLNSRCALKCFYICRNITISKLGEIRLSGGYQCKIANSRTTCSLEPGVHYYFGQGEEANGISSRPETSVGNPIRMTTVFEKM